MIYNLLLLLFAIGSFPKLAWDRWKKKKRGPALSDRLGLHLPDPKNKPVIWIHAVSLGEMKSAEPLYRSLRAQYPDSFFLVTTQTATGLSQAHTFASDVAYLPFDLSFIIGRWTKALSPTHFFLIESDIWPGLLSQLKKQKTKIFLISGKLSAISAKRFLFLGPFSRKLFSHFDALCIQNELYAQRFSPFTDPAKLHITGNLKLAIRPQPLSFGPYLHLLNPSLFPLTIACTHAPEEELLLKALQPLLPRLQIFLAPRHPERFAQVEALLKKLALPYLCWSKPLQRTENIFLIDAMGQLPLCYSLSRLALVAGSFVPHVGGHNVLEPPLYHCPVLFGPYTYNQTEFAEKALQSKAGQRVTLAELLPLLEHFLRDPAPLIQMKSGAQHLFSQGQEILEKTLRTTQEADISS